MKKNKDNITEEQLKNQFAKKYLAYALSTITQRALPDVVNSNWFRVKS